MNSPSETKKVSLIYGAAMVISTAVGAGMMSLPIVSIGMWFFLSVAVIIVTSLYMLATGSMLLEVNMKYPLGTGFHSMIKDCLGEKSVYINDIAMMFNGFVLLYAYITAGTHTVMIYSELFTGFEINASLSALLFTAVLGAVICCKPIIISKVSSVLIFTMLCTFAYILINLGSTVALSNIINHQQSVFSITIPLLPYVILTLPFFLAATGYQQIIPMLRTLYKNKPTKVMKSILLGLSLVSLFYILWMFVIMGNQSQSDMINTVNTENADIEGIVSLISHNNNELSAVLFFFVQVAVITSFIGVAKGLLDYLSDIMINQLNLTPRYPRILVLVPPLVCSLLLPNGFVIAIGFAGLAGAIWSGIVPALLVLASRKKHPDDGFVTYGGIVTPWLILCYSLLIICSMLL
ncbi:aromatic amino acid transport family protein [Shewanella sp. YLB-07]|uniref:aromatic amino acid transport family protein n=1 Tax=Shewanella sp. YLB-07 TaxID=2601268 RepID=UPI00188460BC|nr:aromatic amino acid transport family protein [Shewanella sp. YLB-07]